MRSQLVPKDWNYSCIFSDHNALKLELNHKTKFWRTTSTWKLKNEWVNNEFKEEFLKTDGNKWKWKHSGSKPLGCSKGSPKKEVYSNTSLSQEKRSSQIHNLTLELEKEQQIKPKLSSRRELIKIRAETNEIETIKEQ